MIKSEIKIAITAAILSLIAVSFVSCSNSNSADKKNASESSSAVNTEKLPNDFSGLASQKYADAFAQKNNNIKYTLKWSYKGEDTDKETNYICYDGTTESYSINMTRPLFNDAKFIIKDHKMYDIYDESSTYVITDMSKTAMEYGYLNVQDFESYAADIFAGLLYLGSGTDEIDGVRYNYDAFSTDKSVELRFFMSDNYELYAIEAKYDNNEDTYMFIDEFSEQCPENIFEIPSEYTEDK